MTEMVKAAVFLFEYSGITAYPWAEAGYDCFCIDIQHPPGMTRDPIHPNIVYICADLMQPVQLPESVLNRVRFVAAFPPCDHLAVSGARWFKGKGLRKLADSIHLFATAAEFCESLQTDMYQTPYMIENPVSTISTYWRKADYSFNPHEYTNYCEADNYTKKTCLWTGGGFVMPPASKNESLGAPDDRIHKCPPGKDRSNVRSATPEGFSRAVFEHNQK